MRQCHVVDKDDSVVDIARRHIDDLHLGSRRAQEIDNERFSCPMTTGRANFLELLIEPRLERFSAAANLARHQREFALSRLFDP